jgi:hypothetical protein
MDCLSDREMIDILAVSNQDGEQNAGFNRAYNVAYRPVCNFAKKIPESFQANQAEFEILSGKVFGAPAILSR